MTRSDGEHLGIPSSIRGVNETQISSHRATPTIDSSTARHLDSFAFRARLCPALFLPALFSRNGEVRGPCHHTIRDGIRAIPAAAHSLRPCAPSPFFERFARRFARLSAGQWCWLVGWFLGAWRLQVWFSKPNLRGAIGP